jgi:hypothetical protein
MTRVSNEFHSQLQSLRQSGRENQFIVLRGHEVPEVEDTIAARDGFLIVSKRGAGAEFVKEHSERARN